MISKLRLKFVVCTVVMFAACFAVLISATTIYNKMVYYQDTYQELSWLGETDPQKHVDDDISDKLNFDILYYGYNPIYCLKVDGDKNIISRQVIGGDNPPMLSGQIMDRIISAGDDEWIVISFVFYQKKLEGNETLYIITDCSSEEHTAKLLAKLILAAVALLLITIISIWLSKFIAKPAKLALMHEKQITSDASHELKNPISAIRVNLNALSIEGVKSVHLDNAIAETDKMSELVKKLLTLSRAERLENVYDADNFDLSDLVEKIALTYEGIAFGKGLSMNYDVEPDVFYHGSEKDIENAISTIIDNAIKYTNEGGKVFLSLKRQGRKRIIAVEDTGTGIAPEDIPHIFDRFYVSDKSRTGDSFGLGLAIAKAIINKNGGSITVSSKVGVGSRFEITL